MRSVSRWGVGARARLGVATLLAALGTACLLPAPAAQASSFTRGFTDDVFGDPAWVAKAVPTGAHIVLVGVIWSEVEPRAPAPGADPSDPAGSQFAWAPIDAQVRNLAGRGISVAFLVTQAPTWAETPGGPSSLEANGAWRPSASALGQFAAALARRYSGSYPDPLSPGRSLPRVRAFQAWGEANLTAHLAPQWVRSGRSWTAVAPALYRSMLNSFYAGVKSVHPDNEVITSGLAPYGDPPGACASSFLGTGCRMPPALFDRDLLCLSGAALVRAPCSDPAHFDALAIDPYEVASPATHALNPDDVSAPDLGKLTRIVKRAVATGRALPRVRKQLWVTEFGYDSDPPNPGGVSLATQARWLEQGFYIFWTEGVNTVVWYLIRDQSATYSPDWYYSGVYYWDGQPKPSFEAFRFPFVVMPSGRGAVAWGISPGSGQVAVQLERGRSWKTLFRVRGAAGAVFVHELSGTLHGSFRAVVGGESSLIWQR